MKYRIGVASLFVALVAGALALPAVAQVPNRIGYTGYLANDGGPVNGDVEVTVSVFASPFPSGSESALWTETHPTVAVSEGAFTLSIGSRTAMPATLFDASGLFFEFTVNGDRLEPRSPIESVPYAFRANRADEAARLTGFDPGSVQPSTSVVCPAGSFVAEISATGAVTCAAALGTVTGVAAERGLTRTSVEGLVTVGVDFTVVQSRVLGSCSAGQFATGISTEGVLTCASAASIDLSTIQARIANVCADGQGMFGATSDGTPQCRAFQRPIATTTCEFGIAAVDANGAVTCAASPGNTVAAGFGLNRTGDVLSVVPTTMQRRISADCQFGIRAVNEDGSVTCAANPGVSYTFSTGLRNTANTITVDQAVIQARVLADCEYGIRSINANGSAVCTVNNDTDSNTTYTAGTGLSLAGTTFSANTSYLQRRVSGDCARGITGIAADGSVTCVTNAITCPVGQYMYGIDEFGTALCRILPGGI